MGELWPVKETRASVNWTNHTASMRTRGFSTYAILPSLFDLMGQSSWAFSSPTSASIWGWVLLNLRRMGWPDWEPQYLKELHCSYFFLMSLIHLGIFFYIFLPRKIESNNVTYMYEIEERKKNRIPTYGCLFFRLKKIVILCFQKEYGWTIHLTVLSILINPFTADR